MHEHMTKQLSLWFEPFFAHIRAQKLSAYAVFGQAIVGVQFHLSQHFALAFVQQSHLVIFTVSSFFLFLFLFIVVQKVFWIQSA